MFLKASTLLLLPALIVQGYMVNKKHLRLPEPEGERWWYIWARSTNTFLLILGDSPGCQGWCGDTSGCLTRSAINLIIALLHY